MSAIIADLFIVPLALIMFLLQSLVNLLLLYIILSLFNIKASLRLGSLFAALMAIPYLLCFYMVQLIPVSSPRIFGLLYYLSVFYNPAYILLYYIMLRKLFKLSRIRVLAILSLLMGLQYISGLLFLFCQDLITLIPPVAGKHPILIDILSLTLLTPLLLLCYFIFRGKMKIYNTELPSSLENASFSLARHLMKTIALNAIAYGLLVACSMFMLEGRRVPLTPNQSVLFALFIIILVLWMMLYVSINMIRNRNRKDQSREEYYASLKIANEDFRGVKHDFYNMLQVYDGYLQMQNYDGLQRFHRSLFQATRQAGDSLSVLESFKSRMAVYGLLQAKLQKARNAGVTLYIDLVCDLSGVVLEDLDLCRVLSVALDNAIEAAEQSSKKLVNLSFQRKEEDTIMMVLSNTTREDVDTRLIFQPGFTTKSNHAGHGLKQVRRILSQYDFCSFHVTYSQNLFTLFLLLHVKA